MANYIGKAMSISTFKSKQWKLAPTVTVLCTCMHHFTARKSVHANINPLFHNVEKWPNIL